MCSHASIHMYVQIFAKFGLLVCQCMKKIIALQNPRRKMQVALLAEPKIPLESNMFMSTSNEIWWLFCTHNESLLCIQAQAHMHMFYRMRKITSVVYGRNAENKPVSR